MHVKSKWQFKNSSLEKSRKSFGISDHMSQEKIAFSLYSNPLKTTMLYTEAKLFLHRLGRPVAECQPIFYPSMPDPDCQ